MDNGIENSYPQKKSNICIKVSMKSVDSKQINEYNKDTVKNPVVGNCSEDLCLSVI